MKLADIIVVFPKQDNALKIRNILLQNGFSVIGACTSGTRAAQIADDMEEGIIVCGYKFQDMLYSDLRELLPRAFQFALIATESHWDEGLEDGVIGLSLPIKVHDLINTVNLICESMDAAKRRRKAKGRVRSTKEKETIQDAKALLMTRNGMSEEEAHRYLQQCSMESGNNMVETAEMVLSIMKE